MKWEPIETAPKDGTPIIGLWGESAVERHWWVPQFAHMPPRWSPVSLDTHGCGCCGSDDEPPTHWMPKPELPK